MSYCKYYVKKEQRSPDGINWFDTGNYQKGNLIECGLEYCDETSNEIIHDWIDVPNEYICVDETQIEGNLCGKWTDNSVSSQWRYTDIETERGEVISLAGVTNSKTKEFCINLTPRTSFYELFYGNSVIEKIYSVPFNCKGIVNMHGFLQGCYNLNEIRGIEDWDVSSVEDMQFLFSDNYEIKEFNLSRWNTKNLINMYGLFGHCHYLEKVDISNWDVSKVTNMGELFEEDFALTSLDLSGWNTESLKTTNKMFYKCENITSIDLSKFKIDKISSATSMFYGCKYLNHIKCSQEFKDWCWRNKNNIGLPLQMQSGGSGTWEIV